LWKIWEVKRLARQLADANLSALYRIYNEAKKSNLLYTLFSDILILNRKLDEGISMGELIVALQTKGAIELSEDKAMREATVSKIVLLMMALPKIKQNFELLATMYPYYWFTREAKWQQGAFLKDQNDPSIAAERKHLIPAVRREVRSLQGNMQRSLMEIEAAARPLDVLLAKKEIDGHWQSRTRKYAPLVTQGVFAALMISSGGIGTPLAGFFASGVLGQICNKMLEDIEAVSQIQRAAKTIFPWWEVFIKTLLISIYETGQFIDSQSISAMQRDKRLLDQVALSEKSATIQRMQELLRKQIVTEHENRFIEVLEGKSLLLANIADDIKALVDKEMNQKIDDFVSGMGVTSARVLQN
jgi:hypothetical protein